jgi:hypothetical protein
MNVNGGMMQANVWRREMVADAHCAGPAAALWAEEGVSKWIPSEHDLGADPDPSAQVQTTR